MADEPVPDRPDRVLQATVVASGPDGGQVLLDDGSRLGFPAAAVAPGTRLLRRGQRVRLRCSADGAVLGVALPGTDP